VTSSSSKDPWFARNDGVRRQWHGGGGALQQARDIPKAENHCFRGASHRVAPSGLRLTGRLRCAPQIHHEQVEVLRQGFR
jgi:hypothetical protein